LGWELVSGIWQLPFAVATSNFQGNLEVLIEILVVSLLGLVLLMVIAGYLGKRNGV